MERYLYHITHFRGSAKMGVSGASQGNQYNLFVILKLTMARDRSFFHCDLRISANGI